MRTRTVLLAIIALGVVAIAGLLAWDILGDQPPKQHSAAWEDAHEKNETRAWFICRYEIGMSNESPRLDGCIAEQLDELTSEWEADNPDDIWE